VPTICYFFVSKELTRNFSVVYVNEIMGTSPLCLNVQTCAGLEIFLAERHLGLLEHLINVYFWHFLRGYYVEVPPKPFNNANTFPPQ
jgi:hypothetical protein